MSNTAKMPQCSIIYTFCLFVCFSEREYKQGRRAERERERERDRERERENLKQAPHSTQIPKQDSVPQPWDHDLS